MKITAKDLSMIRDPLLTLDVEVCGIVLEGRNKLHIDKLGNKLEHRGTCQHSKYTKYIWHTHNIGLIAYPSPEDIYTMLKFHANNFENNYPHVSLVFTEWGIWEIAFIHRKFDLDQNWTRFLYQLTDRAFHPVWAMTNKGTGSLNNKAKKLIDKTVKGIANAINNSNHVFDNAFQMYFTPWEKISSDYEIKSE